MCPRRRRDAAHAVGEHHDWSTVSGGALAATLIAGTAWVGVTPATADGERRPSCMGQPATIVTEQESTVGTRGPDVIVASFGHIRARAGADLVCLQQGTGSAVHGGPGDDRVKVRSGGIAYGNAGDDDLMVRGNRFFSGLLLGGAGDDKLRARVDQARFYPGGGDDIVRGAHHQKDSVDFDGANRRVTVDLRKGSARGQGRDRLFSVENLAGSRHADVLYGDHRRNSFQGRRGSDTILLGGGDDRALGFHGDDAVYGGSGDDKLEGGVGSDALFGRTGDDRLIERDRPEPNTINGGPGTDRCFGGYTVPPNTEIGCEQH